MDFNDSEDENVSSEWKKVERDMRKVGLKEGLADGRQLNFQSSFDKGYQEGFIKGFQSAQADFERCLKEHSTLGKTPELLQKASRELCETCSAK